MRLRDVAVSFALLAALTLDIWQAYDFLGTPSLRDFGQFYASSRAFLAGRSLYASTGTLETATHPVIAANMNAPHWHLLINPLARWLPVTAAGVVWLALSVLAASVTLLIVVRELKLSFRSASLLVLVATAFGGTGSTLSNGQSAMVLALPMALAWRGARRGDTLSEGCWLGACLSLKPFLLVFAPYYAVHRGWQVMSCVILVVILAVGLGTYVFGIRSYAEWIQAMAQVHWTASPLNGSLRGLFQRWFAADNPYVSPLYLNPNAVPWLWLMSVTVVCGIVMWSLNRLTDVDLAWSLLIVTALLISPLGWVYYLWLGIGPLATLVPRMLATRDWRFEATFVAVVALCWSPRSLVLGTPSAIGTLIISSLYGWGLLFLWVGLVREARIVQTSPARTSATANTTA